MIWGYPYFWKHPFSGANCYPWEKRYISLLIDPININHSFIGKIYPTRPMDPSRISFRDLYIPSWRITKPWAVGILALEINHDFENGGSFSHTIHGFGIYIPMWIVDFYGTLLGKNIRIPWMRHGFGSWFSPLHNQTMVVHSLRSQPEWLWTFEVKVKVGWDPIPHDASSMRLWGL